MLEEGREIDSIGWMLATCIESGQKPLIFLLHPTLLTPSPLTHRVSKRLQSYLKEAVGAGDELL